MIGWLKKLFRRKPEERRIRVIDMSDATRWGEPAGTAAQEPFELVQVEAQDIAPGDYTRMVSQRGRDARWQFFQDVTVLGDEVRCSILRPDRSSGMMIYAYGQMVEVARPAEAVARPVWGVLSDWLSGRRR